MYINVLLLNFVKYTLIVISKYYNFCVQIENPPKTKHHFCS